MYDAASNGHLEIVELLLDRGASAIIKTDEGDTALNILKDWYKKNHLTRAEDVILYQSLITRMTEILERAGQKVLSNNYNIQTYEVSRHINKVRSNEVKMSSSQENVNRSMLLDFNDDDVIVLSGNIFNYLLI